MLSWSEYAKAFIALIVIVNPISTIPLFAILTAGDSPARRAQIAQIASLSVAVVLAMAALMGEAILRFFGITMASFKVGGAILLLLMAVSMMELRPVRAKQTPEEALEARDQDSIAVVPLAIPLLAGPGALSTTIIYQSAGHGVLHLAIIVVICLAVAALTWVTLRLGDWVTRKLGQTGINIAIRVMGLLLAAVAVEIFAGGIVTLLPGLGPRP
jgi:MarC family membrane protein